jgi:hypothetical protein
MIGNPDDEFWFHGGGAAKSQAHLKTGLSNTPPRL